MDRGGLGDKCVRVPPNEVIRGRGRFEEGGEDRRRGDEGVCSWRWGGQGDTRSP